MKEAHVHLGCSVLPSDCNSATLSLRDLPVLFRCEWEYLALVQRCQHEAFPLS